jgi:hypothetical protein
MPRKNKKVAKVVVRKLGKEKAWGQCWHDDKNPLIEIDPRLGAKRALEVLCHEQLHLSLPDLSEKQIDRLGKEVSEILWRQNYRKVLIDKHSIPTKIS